MTTRVLVLLVWVAVGSSPTEAQTTSSPEVPSSCPVYKRMENVRVENSPMFSWIVSGDRRPWKCWQHCEATPGCISFHLEGTTCSLFQDSVWPSSGEPGLLVYPGTGNLFYIIVQDRDWFPVYKISSGAGAGFYSLWTGSTSTDDVTSCHVTPQQKCAQHYKHPLLEIWDKLMVQQVQVSMYANGTELFSLRFRATGTDRVGGWWDSARLLEARTPGLPWSVDPTELELAQTGSGPLSYFVGGFRPLGERRNLFGVKENSHRQCLGSHTLEPHLVFSVDGSPILIEKPGLVFNEDAGVRYQMNFSSAVTACEARGARLSSLEELTQAQEGGLNCCLCGFLSDGSRKIPMQYTDPNCGTEGINACDYATLANAYCTIPENSAQTADTFVISIK